MEPQEHSKIAPSSLGVTVYCAGSVPLQAQYPDLNDSGEEGRASHWAVEPIFKNQTVSVGDVTPHGTVLDSDMIKYAKVYVNYIRSIAPPACTYIEEKVSLPLIHPICFGTIDARYMVGRTLHIFDYKYGFIPVEAYENWQCMGYATRFINEVDDIFIHIIQPRAHHSLGRIRTWHLTSTDLKLIYLPIIQQAAIKALYPHPPCIPGMHCKYCSARIVCPAAIDATNLIIGLCDQAIPANMSDSQISKELVFLKMAKTLIDARVNGIEAQIETNLLKGKTYPHWHLEPGRGATVWTKPEDEIFKIGDLLGIDLKKEPQPITPIQAKDKGLNPVFFKNLTKHMSGKLKLKQIDNNYGKKLFGGKK
jgi:hypothetical protein